MNLTLASMQRQSLPVKKTTDQMLEAGMLCSEEVGERTLLKATRLGRITCRHQLQPVTVLKLRRFLEEFNTFTDFDLLLMIATTADCEPVLPVDFEDLENLAEELARRSSRLFEDFDHALELLDVGGKRLLSALKVSLVLWRWTVVGDADQVAEEDNCYPFEISRLIESMDRVLLACAAVRRCIDEPFPDRNEDSEPTPKSDTLLRIELLRQKVLNGIDGPAANLTLVDGIGSSWARRLAGHGVSSLESLTKANAIDLVNFPGLSEKRAQRWIKQSSELLDSVPPPITAKGIPTLPPDTDLQVDPYRLRRAIDLTVRRSKQDEWNVSGGSEPRQVARKAEELTCSCPDRKKGNLCKHMLAVRLYLKDEVLKRTIQQMKSNTEIPYLDLFSLWFDRQ